MVLAISYQILVETMYCFFFVHFAVGERINSFSSSKNGLKCGVDCLVTNLEDKSEFKTRTGIFSPTSALGKKQQK